VGPHLTQGRLRCGLPPRQVAVSFIQAFGRNKHGPKKNFLGGGGSAPPPLGGERVPHLTQSPGPRSTSILSDILIHAAIWPQQIWAENWGGVAGSPPNTMWPGPRPTCMPSFILIRPTLWPQCTNVTDRTDRQTGQNRQTTDR